MVGKMRNQAMDCLERKNKAKHIGSLHQTTSQYSPFRYLNWNSRGRKKMNVLFFSNVHGRLSRHKHFPIYAQQHQR